MKHLYGLFLAAWLIPFPAQADIVNEYIEIACRPELNVLTISAKNVNGAFAEQAFKEKKKELRQKYGIIDLMELFTVARDFSSQEEREYHTQCRLQSPDAEGKAYTPIVFDITLKGISQNPNPQGECGGWRSFSLTVKNKGKTYIDTLPFAENCSSERGIFEVVINPQEGYMTVNTPHQIDRDLFWINHNRLQTIKRDSIYPNYDLYGERATPWSEQE